MLGAHGEGDPRRRACLGLLEGLRDPDADYAVLCPDL